MDYKKIGIDVFNAVGGNDNVTQLTHCATRLRFELKNFTSVDKNKLKKIPGVLDVIEKGGQLQVVIGQDVQIAYRAANELFDHKSGKKDVQDNKEEKKTLFERFSSMMLGIFNPIAPAITGAGMIKAVLALLKAFSLIDPKGSTFFVINFISDAAFYFLPMILAYSTARYFKTNEGLALTLAGVLLHPSFAAAVAAKNPVAFFGMNVTLANYGTSVFPIILSVILMSYVDKFADRFLPTCIKFIGKPLIILGVTAPVALIVLGPIGYYGGIGLANVISFIDARAGWFVPTILGGLFPLLVMAGMHAGLAPIVATQLSTMGHETVGGPASLASNIAQGGVALAVAVKAKKNTELRQKAISGGISALMGITEPAMYGVNLPLKKPLIIVMISGAIAGLFAGVTGLVRYSFGSPGIPTLPVFIGDDPMNIVKAIGTLIISLTVSFVLTLLVKFDIPDGEETQENTEEINENAVKNELTENIIIGSPLKGKVVPLSEVPDSVFANEVLGKGVAVMPEGNKVVAPFDGTVASVFPSKHAIGIIDKNGCEVLIHIGLDTVQLEGEHFTAKVAQGDTVTKGQTLVIFDKDEIEKAGYSMVTPVVVTNTNQFNEIFVIDGNEVDFGDELLKVE